MKKIQSLGVRQLIVIKLEVLMKMVMENLIAEMDQTPLLDAPKERASRAV